MAVILSEIVPKQMLERRRQLFRIICTSVIVWYEKNITIRDKQIITIPSNN